MAISNRIIGLIKSVRIEECLSAEELGERLGISKFGVLDMERREVLGRISVSKLHKALNAMGYRLECRAISQEKMQITKQC